MNPPDPLKTMEAEQLDELIMRNLVAHLRGKVGSEFPADLDFIYEPNDPYGFDNSCTTCYDGNHFSFWIENQKVVYNAPNDKRNKYDQFNLCPLADPNLHTKLVAVLKKALWG